jgi:hypothetical protein
MFTRVVSVELTHKENIPVTLWQVGNQTESVSSTQHNVFIAKRSRNGHLKTENTKHHEVVFSRPFSPPFRVFFSLALRTRRTHH